MQLSYKTLDETIIKRKTVLKIPWIVDDSIPKEALLNYLQITKPISFFLYKLHKLPEMSEETLKCLCIHLYLKLNSDLHETGMCEELNLSGKWLHKNH